MGVKMKAVILLAGKGRRIQKEGYVHKSLIKIDRDTLLYHIVKNIEKAGIKEIVPIIGYNGDYVLDEIQKAKEKAEIKPVWNRKYDETNNLFSLYQARELLEGEDFISINGDMIFDYHILDKIMQNRSSQIAVDDGNYDEPVDSPGILVENSRIVDLGRHIPFDQKYGYAVGIYRYSNELSETFFKESEAMLKENINAGFHDPLVNLFKTQEILPCSVKNYLWTDIDEAGDIEKAMQLWLKIKEKNS